VSGIDDPSSPTDQDAYLRALKNSGSVDHIEYGGFVRRVKTAPLVTWDAKGRPRLVTSGWPVGVINPGAKHLAGKLKDSATAGVGNHWWGTLTAAAYRAHQLPDPVGRTAKPHGW